MRFNRFLFSAILTILLFSVFVAAERGEQLWPNGLNENVDSPSVFQYSDLTSAEYGLGAIWHNTTQNSIQWTVGNLVTGQWPPYSSKLVDGGGWDTSACTAPIAKSNSSDELLGLWYDGVLGAPEASFYDYATDTWSVPHATGFMGGEVYDIVYDPTHDAWTSIIAINGGNTVFVDTYTDANGWQNQTITLGGGVLVGAIDAEFDATTGPDGLFVITIHDDNGANQGVHIDCATWEGVTPGEYCNGDGTGWGPVTTIAGTAGKNSSQGFDINEQTGNGGYVFEVAGTVYITDWTGGAFAVAATTVENAVPQPGTLKVSYYSTTDGNDDGAVFWQPNGSNDLYINALDNSGNPLGVGLSLPIRVGTVASGAFGDAINYDRLDKKAVIVPILHAVNTEGVFGIPYHTDNTYSTQTPNWNVVGDGHISVVWASDMPTKNAQVEWDSAPPPPFGNADIEAATNIASMNHTVDIFGIATGQDYVYQLTQIPWGSDQIFTDDDGGGFYDFDTYPDLLVTDIRCVPNPVSQGNTVNVSADILNAGAADIPGDFDNDYSDDAGGAEFCVMNGLSAGSQDSCGYVVDTTGYSIGDHVVTVQTDTGGDVTESDEGNNSTSSDGGAIPHLTVQAAGLQADLEISDLGFVPNPVTRGNPLTVTIEVTNNGTGTTGAGFNNSYIDDEGTADACAIATLGSGLTDDCDVIIDTTGYSLLHHLVTVEADSDDDISESDEGNNEYSDVFIVFPAAAPPGGPDLVVDAVVFSDNPVVAGTTIDITVTIENQGDAGTGVGFDTEMQDPNGIVLPDCTLAALGSGNTDDCVWADYDTSALPNGYNKFTITTDVNGDVAETDETNNIAFRYLTITSGGGPGGTGFGAAPGLELVGYAIVAITGLAVFVIIRKN